MLLIMYVISLTNFTFTSPLIINESDRGVVVNVLVGYTSCPGCGRRNLAIKQSLFSPKAMLNHRMVSLLSNTFASEPALSVILSFERLCTRIQTIRIYAERYRPNLRIDDQGE